MAREIRASFNGSFRGSIVGAGPPISGASLGMLGVGPGFLVRTISASGDMDSGGVAAAGGGKNRGDSLSNSQHGEGNMGNMGTRGGILRTSTSGEQWVSLF